MHDSIYDKFISFILKLFIYIIFVVQIKVLRLGPTRPVPPVEPRLDGWTRLSHKFDRVCFWPRVIWPSLSSTQWLLDLDRVTYPFFFFLVIIETIVVSIWTHFNFRNRIGLSFFLLQSRKVALRYCSACQPLLPSSHHGVVLLPSLVRLTQFICNVVGGASESN